AVVSVIQNFFSIIEVAVGAGRVQWGHTDLLIAGSGHKVLYKIMSGMGIPDEGISTWVTVSFLTGSLKPPGISSIGMLDLGARCTQVILPLRVESTLLTSPVGSITSFQIFNRTYNLHFYIYWFQRRIGTCWNNIQALRTEGGLASKSCALAEGQKSFKTK
ncbi:hypothetical protein GH733_004721, partial [Mirounga leonina]